MTDHNNNSSAATLALPSPGFEPLLDSQQAASLFQIHPKTIPQTACQETADFDLLTMAEVAAVLKCSKTHVCKAVADVCLVVQQSPPCRWVGGNSYAANRCWHGFKKTNLVQ